MKARSVLVYVCAFIIEAALVFGQSYPKPIGMVNDFAGMLQPDEATRLNAELISFNERTGFEVAVVTVQSLEGQDVVQYATGLATEWRVGKAGQNNGIILLVAQKERKMRIQTASGARSILTDTKAAAIRDNSILPYLKKNDMGNGIITGTHAIMAALNQQAPVKVEREHHDPVFDHVTEPSNTGTYTLKVFVIIMILLGVAAIIVIIVSAARKNKIRADNQRRQRHEEERVRLAKKAQIEGPRLMESLPGLLRRTERRLLKKPTENEKALAALQKAKEQYEEAQRMQLSSGNNDWMLMYMLLNNSQSNCLQAQEIHRVSFDTSATQYHSGVSTSSSVPNNHRAPDPTPTPSYDPPAAPTIEFGGGSGFDGGGGGGGGGGADGSF